MEDSMSRRFAPGVKLPVVVAGGPQGGVLEVAVSGDRKVYYRRYTPAGIYQRITMPVARLLVETMERDCCEVPERLRHLDENLVQELRNRTADPALEPRTERVTNWGRQIVSEQDKSFTQVSP